MVKSDPQPPADDFWRVHADTPADLGSALHDREAVFRNLFDRIGDGIFVIDPTTLGFVQFNTRAHESLGYTHEEFAALTVADIQADDRPEWVAARLADITTTGGARFENRHRHKGGSVVEVIVDNRLVTIAGRTLIVTVVHDVTDLKSRARLLAEAERLAQLGSWELSHPDERLTWSDETFRIFDKEPDSFVPTFAGLLELVHPEDRDRLATTFRDSVEHGLPYDCEHRVLFPDGRVKVVHERGRTEFDSHGRATRSVGTCQDVTERVENAVELVRIAYEDQLTGLPNRAAARMRLDELTAQTDRVAVLHIDLENFQQINGIYGHEFGDELLRSTGQRIAAVLAQRDHLARVGGDEFLVLRPGAAADEALVLAQQIRAAIQSQDIGPFGVPLRLDARVGVTAGTGRDGATLLQQADTALHLARGGRACQMYRPDMADEMRKRLLILSQCGVAVANDELFLEFQPQCTATGDLVGVEALLRWRTLQGEVIPPARFIPVVENTSLMERIGVWVVNHAAAQVAAWRRAGYRVPAMSINVSARQFEAPQGVCDTVVAALAEYGLEPADLELEITESVMMPRTGSIPAEVARLAELGVRLAVDDFGTGYSSMSVLHQLPLSKLKIDRSLIAGLPDSKGAAAIVEATLALSAALGLDCLAEGVESQAELDWLIGAGCGIFQGFHFDVPRPAADFAQRWLVGTEAVDGRGR